jgi:hypothetical protein
MAQSVWNEPEREAFITFISENPMAGDVIPGAGNLRKVRWKREGMGKSGGRSIEIMEGGLRCLKSKWTKR